MADKETAETALPETPVSAKKPDPPAKAVTLEQAVELLAERAARAPAKGRKAPKKAAAKKAPAKKPAAGKAPSKKPASAGKAPAKKPAAGKKASA